VDDELLAAYIDGTLSRAQAAQVEEHLASCSDCYELLAEVLHSGAELRSAEDQGNTGGDPEPRFRSEQDLLRRQPPPRRFLLSKPVYVSGGVALAAAAAIFLFVGDRRSPLATIAEAVGTDRLTVARPTGGFEYAPIRMPTRGTDPTEAVRLHVRAEIQRLREQRSPSLDERHALGVAQMLVGDAAESVTTLTALRTERPDVAEYEADLGAAYISRLQQTGEREDANRALTALDRATTMKPTLSEAWYNKALVLDALGRTQDAATTWARYLELDSSSPWSMDARRLREAGHEPVLPPIR
jgi:anti-sigma factor RsiW